MREERGLRQIGAAAVRLVAGVAQDDAGRRLDQAKAASYADITARESAGDQAQPALDRALGGFGFAQAGHAPPLIVVHPARDTPLREVEDRRCLRQAPAIDQHALDDPGALYRPDVAAI